MKLRKLLISINQMRRDDDPLAHAEFPISHSRICRKTQEWVAGAGPKGSPGTVIHRGTAALGPGHPSSKMSFPTKPTGSSIDQCQVKEGNRQDAKVAKVRWLSLDLPLRNSAGCVKVFRRCIDLLHRQRSDKTHSECGTTDTRRLTRIVFAFSQRRVVSVVISLFVFICVDLRVSVVPPTVLGALGALAIQLFRMTFIGR